MTSIKEAVAKCAEARERFNNAKTRSARLVASEELDFWIGKKAALSVGK